MDKQTVMDFKSEDEQTLRKSVRKSFVRKSFRRQCSSDDRAKITVWLCNNSQKVNNKRYSEITKILLKEFPAIPTRMTMQKILGHCGIDMRQNKVKSPKDPGDCGYLSLSAAHRLAYRVGTAGAIATETLAKVIGQLHMNGSLDSSSTQELVDTLYDSYNLYASMQRKLSTPPISELLRLKWDEAGGAAQKPIKFED
jgi:hypothetical protein